MNDNLEAVAQAVLASDRRILLKERAARRPIDKREN
jgi:hypothetical protein